MEAYKQEFIEFMVESDVLKFGDFTLKSGRKSPFFMNAGAYVTGSQLHRLGQFYARAIHDEFGLDFDVVFGPAYKGIPLSVITTMALSELYGKEARYCSNRKEVKDHGADKGNLLGAEQSGFIADIGFETYQKIMNEAVAELRAEGLHVPGLSDGEQEVVEQMRFIDDAHIDIEVEAALPDAYVSQQAERLKLYRELDSTKDEEALQAFESRLADRFGPLPRAAKELLNVVRLRWEAIRLGMERVKVKNGLMIVHFVGEENSPFYKSEAFMTLLQRVTQRPDRFVLKQHNNRLAMTVRNVKDVEDAYKTLQQL